jgi:hypothetical protein
VEQLRLNISSYPAIGLAHIFLNYKNGDESAINILGSMLQQLLRSLDNLPQSLIVRYEEHQKHQTRLSIAEVVQQMVETSAHFSELYIVMDALDEYDEGEGVRDVLLREVSKIASLPKFHIFITSRWLTTIESQLGGYRRVEIRAAREDVCKYVEGRISSSSRLLRRVKGDPELRVEIVNTVVDACQGM